MDKDEALEQQTVLIIQDSIIIQKIRLRIICSDDCCKRVIYEKETTLEMPIDIQVDQCHSVPLVISVERIDQLDTTIKPTES